MIPNHNPNIRAVYARTVTDPNGAPMGHDEFSHPVIAWNSDGHPLVIHPDGALVPAEGLRGAAIPGSGRW